MPPNDGLLVQFCRLPDAGDSYLKRFRFPPSAGCALNGPAASKELRGRCFGVGFDSRFRSRSSTRTIVGSRERIEDRSLYASLTRNSPRQLADVVNPVRETPASFGQSSPEQQQQELGTLQRLKPDGTYGPHSTRLGIGDLEKKKRPAVVSDRWSFADITLNDSRFSRS